MLPPSPVSVRVSKSAEVRQVPAPSLSEGGSGRLQPTFLKPLLIQGFQPLCFYPPNRLRIRADGALLLCSRHSSCRRIQRQPTAERLVLPPSLREDGLSCPRPEWMDSPSAGRTGGEEERNGPEMLCPLVCDSFVLSGAALRCMHREDCGSQAAARSKRKRSQTGTASASLNW